MGIRTFGLVAASLIAVTASNRSVAQPGNPRASYDRPISTEKGRLPPGMVVEQGGGLTCLSFPDFTLKIINSGGPAGDVSVTIVPKATVSVPGACSTAVEPGQIVIKTEGQSFTGVKGDFIVLDQADPNGASRVVILDRRTGRPRYSDTVFPQPNGTITSISVDGDMLRLGYVRGINGSCSIPKGGRDCFMKTARENHLPSAVQYSKDFFDLCVSTYQSLKTSLDDPSIVTYAVDLQIPSIGQPRVISRTAPSCYPLP